MHLDQFSSQHRQTKRALIEQTLAKEIGTGTWPVATRLPAESQLIERFGVSRQTVRFAMSDLRARGLIQSQQGVGSVVASRYAVPEFSHSFQTIDELVDYTRNSTGKSVNSEDVLLNEKVASMIGTEVGQAWRQVTTVRTAIGQNLPIGLNVTWLPASYSKVFTSARKNNLPVFIELQKTIGRPISKVRQVCGATLADKGQAKFLMCGVHEALLTIRRWYYTADGALLGLSETLHPPSRFQYAVTLRRATQEHQLNRKASK